MFKVILYLFHLILDAPQLLIHSLRVELGYLADRLFHQLVDVIHGDRSVKKALVLHHLIEHLLQLIFPCLCITFENLIDLVFEEYLFKRTVMPVVLQLIQPDLQLLSEEALGVVCAVSENVMDREELRLVVYNHAGIGRNGNLTIRKCIERIDCLVRGYIIRQVYHDLGR